MAVSAQLAIAAPLGSRRCPTAADAQCARVALQGRDIVGLGFRFRSPLWMRPGVNKAGRGGVPSAVGAELKLGDDSTAGAGKGAGGVVETWFYGSYKAWPEVHRLLTQRNVKSVEWQEAYDLAASGAAILVDVREAQEFEKVHAEGSFGAPLFQLIQGNDLQSNLRRLGYALLTDFSGTERNPNFVEQALQAVNGDKDKLVIVICGIGGTLSTYVERMGPKAKKYADPSRRFGRASRSLRAVLELQEAGLRNVSFLSGGLNTWIHQGLPTEGGK